MKWKPFPGRPHWSISSAGLIRRDKAGSGTLAGQLMMPAKSYKLTATVEFWKSVNGKNGKVPCRVRDVVKEVFGHDLALGPKWIAAVRKYINRYNRKLRGTRRPNGTPLGQHNWGLNEDPYTGLYDPYTGLHGNNVQYNPFGV